MKNVQIYTQQVITLARSLVIKSETIARAMNTPLVELNKPIPTDRREWRYYLHLSGQHHIDDAPVILTSLDNGEEITLTVENLKDHKKTSNVYRYNPEYIERLINKYPNMSVYINGVFNPIDIEVAVAAPDCSILYHNPAYIEKQEASLLIELSNWIRAVHTRFFYGSWEVSQDAFTLAFWTNLYAAIPGRIMLLRSQKTHTQETHSFHIEQFLASHQYLDEFIPYLTLKQKMFLYRNIRYIERNSGKAEILDLLVDVLLTGWDMPTSSYSVGQTIHSPSDGEIMPNPVVYEVPMNFKDQQDGRDANLIDTRTLLQKEFALAYDNSSVFDEYLDDLDRRLQYTQYPEQPTKVIEVTAIDPSELEPFRIEEVLVNEWLHTAAIDRYNIYHEILNPLNGDTLRMTTKQLFVFFIYAAYRGFSGWAEKDIPKFNASGVQLKYWATTEDYLKFLPKGYPGRWDGLITYYTDTHHQLYNNIISPDELYSNAKSILDAKVARHRYGYNFNRTEDRIAAQMAFKFNYPDLSCDLNLPEKTYHEFFQRFGVDYENISDETWQDIAVDALNTATAFEENSEISHKDIQQAMVKLLTRLSSYAVHFASRMATDSPIVTDPLLQTAGHTLGDAVGSNRMGRPITTVNDLSVDNFGSTIVPVKTLDILAVDAPQTVVMAFNQVVELSAEVSQVMSFDINPPSTALERNE